MSNWLYDTGRNAFAKGDIKWKASAGDTIRSFLVDAASYTPNSSTHDFLDDVPSASRKGNGGSTNRTEAPTLTLIDPTAGVCDAGDITFTTVPAGNALEYILIFKDAGTDTESQLIALIDTATGLPVTPNGGDINVAWDAGANKIFKL